jgi:hypothetical protein
MTPNQMVKAMMNIGMNANTLGCTHLNIDLYRPMMTLFRETTTSRSNLTIGYVGKSIITMFENVVKNFILSLVVVTLLTNAIYVLTLS